MEKTSFDSNSSRSSTEKPTAVDINPSHTLQIRFKDWRSRHGEIVDDATDALLYTTEHRYRKPTFTLATPSGAPLATACSSKWTMKMDMAFPSLGAEFELTPRHKLGSSCTYVSPAYGGARLTWEHRSRWSRVEFVLLDESAQPIARIQAGKGWSCWSKAFGEIHFAEGRVEGEAQRDEVVATGLTLAYKAVMNRNAAAAGAAASSSSGAVAAAA